MKFGAVPVEEAVGKILAHNLIGQDGRKLFGKGHVVTETDCAALQTANFTSVVVAALEATDLGENEAARRVGNAVAGTSIKVAAPGVGRANLTAEVMGPLYINVPALQLINNIDEGITIATLREYTLVRPSDLLALVKIIPFGVAAARVIDIEAVARELAPVLYVRPLRRSSVGLILSGPTGARNRLEGFIEPARHRVESLGSALDDISYVLHESSAIADAIQAQQEAGRDLILIAGVSAIIDRDDVVPTALALANGNVAHFGVPVDPGSLLMLGYMDNVPVIGAPGCIKSLQTNVIDWILPRLLAGERLTRAHLIAMGHGGLLDDISERPMPRQLSDE